MDYFLLSLVLSILLLGAIVVVSGHVIYRISALVGCFVTATSVLVLLDMDFLGLLFLIVYVGAIAVLFLFIVMLLNLRQGEVEESQVVFWPLALLLSPLFLVPLDRLFNDHLTVTINLTNEFSWHFGLLDQLSVLFNDWVLFLFGCAWVLLVAIVGAIYLTWGLEKGIKRQELSIQSERLFPPFF